MSRRRLLLLGLFTLVISAIAPPGQALADWPPPDALIAKAIEFAAAERNSGEVYTDPASASEVETNGARYIIRRAHDFDGWFTVFARLGSTPVVGYWQVEDSGAVSGKVAPVRAGTGEVDRSDTSSIDLRTTSGTGDGLVDETEQTCRQFLSTLPCNPRHCDANLYILGHAIGPFTCNGASTGTGLTWWSGSNVKYEQLFEYGIPNGYTEIADFDYRAQSCAPIDAIIAWNLLHGPDLDVNECYDFSSGTPQKRSVSYTAKIYWADGAETHLQYNTTSSSLSDLIFYDDDIRVPGSHLMHMEMTESLPFNGVVDKYRFGRAYKAYSMFYCGPNSTNCP